VWYWQWRRKKVRPILGRWVKLDTLLPWVAPMAIERFDPFRIKKGLKSLNQLSSGSMTTKWSNLSITAGETRGKGFDNEKWNDPERVEHWESGLQILKNIKAHIIPITIVGYA
jgi:hypothetical protein